jgi:hypothetical protein
MIAAIIAVRQGCGGHGLRRGGGFQVTVTVEVTVTVAINPKLIARFFSSHTINLTHIIE